MTRKPEKLALALLLMAGCASQPAGPERAAGSALAVGAEACITAISTSADAGLQRLDTDTIRVVNWNIRKGLDPAWADDLRAVGQNADLLILQEASPSMVTSESLKPTFYPAFAEGYQASGRATGVLTLSRVPPVAECDLVTHEPWLRTPKATLVTRYGLSGTNDTLLVVNIHGVNFSIGAAELDAQIRTAEALVSAHQGPVLFSGDFNTWRGGRARLLDEAAVRQGLDRLEYDVDHRKRFMGWALDHIYTRGLLAVTATTHDMESSDHNPMSVEFRLEAPSSARSTAP